MSSSSTSMITVSAEETFLDAGQARGIVVGPEEPSGLGLQGMSGHSGFRLCCS